MKSPTRAMILAAGLGTRLRPLTNDRPKALVEIAGRTLLQLTLDRLRTFGVEEVIINVHHYADKILDYLKANSNFGMRIEISHEETLLDTGGGLKKAAHFFLRDFLREKENPQPFILHNVDVLSTIDLGQMMQFHAHHAALATLAVQRRETSRYLLFDDQAQLCGRKITRPSNAEAGNPQQAPNPQETQTPEIVRPAAHLVPLAFSGIHILSPRIFSLLKEDGAFSIIPAYLRLAAQGEKILAFRADDSYWRDLGRPNQIAQAEQDICTGVFSTDAPPSDALPSINTEVSS